MNKEYSFYLIVVIKLLVIYFILLEAYYLYVGALLPGGTFYLPWLSHFNIIQFFLDGLVYPAKFILECLGYTTRYTNNSIGIENGFGVKIAFQCLGMKVIFAFTSLMLAFPGRRKFIFWITGLATIHLLNLIRVIVIVLVFKYNYNIVTITHDAFNYLSYAIIFLYFYLWQKNNGTEIQNLSK